jgi:hypothetical protein
MIYRSISILIICTLFLGQNNSFAQCEKMKKKKLNQFLGAAEYDNYRSTEIKNVDAVLKEEYQINLFKGVVYKLIFDVSKMPEGVTVKLYDLGKKRGVGIHEEVFNSKTAKKTKDNTYEVTMEFPQRKMMVSYDIMNNTKPGCISFILGYYFKNRIR